MAKVAIYRWPAPNTTAVAALQTLAAAGSLSINGSMAVSALSGTPVVTFAGFSRVISLTSTNNLSAVNFTVTGIYKGALQTQTIAGPNNNTVSTTLLFDSVTSISTDAAAAAVSAGIGATGQTDWYQFNNFSSTDYLSVQVVVTGAITYSFQSTLDDVLNLAITPTVFNTIQPMTAATTSLFLPHPILSIGAGPTILTANMPIKFCNIAITAGTGSLVASILQQGVI